MADIPEGIIVLWPGNNNAWPSGWSRETSLDDRYARGRTSGTAANAGASNHNHNSSAHTHPGGAHTHSTTTGARRYPAPINTNYSNNLVYGTWAAPPMNRRDFGPNNHTHNTNSGSATPGASGNTTATWGDSNTTPLSYEMIAIKSDGTPSGFPDDCVVYYNSGSAPTDWVNHTASAGRFIKAPTGGGNGTGTGGGVHGHSGDAHSHNAASGNHDHAGGTFAGSNNEGLNSSSSSNQNSAWVYQAANNDQHNHTWDLTAGISGAANSGTSPNSGSETYEPPFTILLGIQNTSGADNWLEEAIVMWMGDASSPPDDWTLCNGGNNDSGNATPNLNEKYVKMWASGGSSVLATGGNAGHGHGSANNHQHPMASHTHTVDGSATGTTPRQNNRSYVAFNAHNRSSAHYHEANASVGPSPSNYSNTAQDVGTTSNTEPPYRTAAYLSAPAEPTSGNVGMFGANF
jgi:hypothetical protein